MNSFTVVILIALLIASCRSTEKNKENDPEAGVSDLQEGHARENSDVQEMPVYIDQVELTEVDGKWKLVIRGNLPNPCCKLKEAGEEIREGKFHLTLVAWQPHDAICPQVLEPFTYVHSLPDEIKPDNLDVVLVNKNQYKL